MVTGSQSDNNKGQLCINHQAPIGAQSKAFCTGQSVGIIGKARRFSTGHRMLAGAKKSGKMAPKSAQKPAQKSFLKTYEKSKNHCFLPPLHSGSPFGRPKKG
jgi:hypothetical protein